MLRCTCLLLLLPFKGLANVQVAELNMACEVYLINVDPFVVVFGQDPKMTEEHFDRSSYR